jgi:hypothetical protein
MLGEKISLKYCLFFVFIESLHLVMQNTVTLILPFSVNPTIIGAGFTLLTYVELEHGVLTGLV